MNIYIALFVLFLISIANSSNTMKNTIAEQKITRDEMEIKSVPSSNIYDGKKSSKVNENGFGINQNYHVDSGIYLRYI
jgi:hypothetical protein